MNRKADLEERRRKGDFSFERELLDDADREIKHLKLESEGRLALLKAAEERASVALSDQLWNELIAASREEVEQLAAGYRAMVQGVWAFVTAIHSYKDVWEDFRFRANGLPGLDHTANPELRGLPHHLARFYGLGKFSPHGLPGPGLPT
jgi:hypothetical protein